MKLMDIVDKIHATASCGMPGEVMALCVPTRVRDVAREFVDEFHVRGYEIKLNKINDLRIKDYLLWQNAVSMGDLTGEEVYKILLSLYCNYPRTNILISLIMQDILFKKDDENGGTRRKTAKSKGIYRIQPGAG